MRHPALTKALADAGIEPCRDNSCMFGRAGGQGTNGGCRCIDRTASERYPIEARRYIQRMALVIRALEKLLPEPARALVHADGGACHGTPLVNGRCPKCGISPDMQSAELWAVDRG